MELMEQKKSMVNTTLVLLIKRQDNNISEICLAMKKRGFGQGRWNGVGGKLEAGETIEQGAVRETKEEINVVPIDLKKIAELTFRFIDNPEWDQIVYVYFCEKWKNNPIETEEMKPKWFRITDLPFEQMWPDDKFWLTEVLKDKLVKAEFNYEKNDIILDKNVLITDKL